MTRSLVAAWVLVDELFQRYAFQAHVAAAASVGAPADVGRAWETALRYDRSRRRRLAMTRLLLHGARPFRGWSARTSAISALATGTFVSDDPTGRRSTYIIDTAFVAPVREGARCIAYRGGNAPAPEDVPVGARAAEARRFVWDLAVPIVLRGRRFDGEPRMGSSGFRARADLGD